jgi:hypothetical protein
MVKDFDPSSLPPAVKKVAMALRIAGWTAFWIQLVLGIISALIFMFALIGLPSAKNADSIGSGILFAGVAIVILAVSIYLSFRYTRLARKLRSPSASLRPSRAETSKVIRLTLLVNLGGMFITLIGSEAINGILLGKSLSLPQGGLIASSVDIRDFIQPLDLFIVLGNTHIVFAYFIGVAISLWLLDRVYTE